MKVFLIFLCLLLLLKCRIIDYLPKKLIGGARDNCLNADCNDCHAGYGPKWSCDQKLDTKSWDLVQLMDRAGNYILLRTQDLSDPKYQNYKLEAVPVTFRVFNEAGTGRQEWCVSNVPSDSSATKEVTADTGSNSLLSKLGFGKQSARSTTSQSYQFRLQTDTACQARNSLHFWTPEVIAPSFDWMRLEQNGPRYRLRYSFQPPEANWNVIARLVTFVYSR